MLVVLDATPNDKLDELRKAFESQGGESFIGTPAWEHLNDMAGPTMATFLQTYVHAPLRALVANPAPRLPPLTLRMQAGEIAVHIGDDSFRIARDRANPGGTLRALPGDIDEEGPGP